MSVGSSVGLNYKTVFCEETRVFLLFFAEEEFRSTYLNPLLSQWTLHRPMKQAPPAQSPAPASWDWRDHGAVSPVKNQVHQLIIQ